MLHHARFQSRALQVDWMGHWKLDEEYLFKCEDGENGLGNEFVWEPFVEGGAASRWHFQSDGIPGTNRRK